jgi:glyoxylate reductase
VAKIFVTRKIPYWYDVGRPLMEAGHEVVVYNKNQRIERNELIEEIRKGYDGLLCLLTDKIDPEILGHDENKQLKIIANYAVGYDNINIAACKTRNILVTNTPCEEVNESVAEFAWVSMMALSRNLESASKFAENVGYRGWEPDIFLGEDMKGKTLGIVGMGRIGSMVARRAVGFDMKVIYYNRRPVEGVKFIFKEKIDDLLEEADYVSLHVPLTDETRHLINFKTLSCMKSSAFLVNTARGPVVDEGELVEALKLGKLAGAALDVWENEPNPRPELIEMENVILTPHIASATREARLAMGRTAVANLLAGLSGVTPVNLVQI